MEYIFDKYLVSLPSVKTFTTVTDQLNEFKFTWDMTDEQFVSSFMASPQFRIAQDVYKQATIRGSMGFLLNPNLPPNTPLTQDDFVILETSINPYKFGSSISHLDYETYKNTSDFLMIPLSQRVYS